MPRGVAINVLENAVRDGTFTPILGAACSTLDHDKEPRALLLAEVRRKAAAMVSFLSDSERRYLDELIDCDDALLRVPAAQANENPAPLTALHIALLRLDRSAAAIFKKGVKKYIDDAKKHCEFLWKRRSGLSFPRLLADWHIPLQGRTTRTELLERLNNAIDVAVQVRELRDPSWRKYGLGAGAIVENLTSFRKALYQPNGDLASGASLNLMDLVWIGNLFWHCLRFDLPYHPTTAELAFQLSLCTEAAAGSSRKAPPLLAQAAQVVEGREELLATWFEAYAKHPGQSQFYRVMAQWLKKSFAISDPSAKNLYAPRPLPIVFTTNYDQELESALDAERCPYHVVLPVSFGWGKADPTGVEQTSYTFEPLWLTQRITFSGETRQLNPWEYAGRTASTSEGSDDSQDPIWPRTKFDGPVIVKLHGSPLATLPAKDDVLRPPEKVTVKLEGGYDVIYKHRVIISESDYLEDLRRQIPVWLQRSLSSRKRRLFFLGQSIADWNIRLRLADHISWADSRDTNGLSETATASHPPDSSPVRRVAVNRYTGFFDAAFMDPLHISQLQLELEQVQNTLAEAL
jgi:hypothetical protein